MATYAEEMKKYLAVVCIIQSLYSCNVPQPNETEKKPVKQEVQETAPAEILPDKLLSKGADDSLVKYYKASWDAIKLEKDNGFPQYEDYKDALQPLSVAIANISNRKDLKLPKFKKLHDILLVKLNKANSDYILYGQPHSKRDLTIWCEDPIKQVLNDPDSFRIEDSEVKGQNKKGWVVHLRYSYNGGFGVRQIETITFVLQYNAANSVYIPIDAKAY